MSSRDTDPGELPELDWGYEGKSRVNREKREQRDLTPGKGGSKPTPKPTPIQKPPNPKHVLVIDDDTDVAEVLGVIMDCNGYVVKTVNSAADALKEIMVRDYDAIICDIVMPKMPGDMFYLAVSKVKPHLCERFLFITGHGGDVHVAAFLFRVQRPIVYKPVVMEDLVDAVFQMLARNEAAEKQVEAEKASAAKARVANTAGRPRRA